MQERLQKILAHAGVASRRRAEQMILEGRIRVNGRLVTKMGVRADPAADVVTLDGRRVSKRRKHLYILLNKPRNVLSTSDDPQGRPTALDTIQPRPRERLYPVGRLDFASEGLLLLTNDGDLTRFMTRAGGAPKVYEVKVSGVPTPSALERLRKGLWLDGVKLAPCQIETVKAAANSWLRVSLTQGRNRQIRKMFDAIGHRVMKLRRRRIGFLTDENLRLGSWRYLTDREVERLYSKYGGSTQVPKPGGAEPHSSRRVHTP